jgi:hypothetical protein
VNGCLRLRVQDDTPCPQSVDKLVSRQRPVLAEDRSDGGDAPFLQVVVEAELCVAGDAGSREDRTQQVKQPADVLRRDDVQRAAHEPGTDDGTLLVERPRDRAGIETRTSRAHAECRGAPELRLQAAYVSQDSGRRGLGGRIPGEPLGPGTHPQHAAVG